jgi:hypothetical protein
MFILLWDTQFLSVSSCWRSDVIWFLSTTVRLYTTALPSSSVLQWTNFQVTALSTSRLVLHTWALYAASKLAIRLKASNFTAHVYRTSQCKSFSWVPSCLQPSAWAEWLLNQEASKWSRSVERCSHIPSFMLSSCTSAPSSTILVLNSSYIWSWSLQMYHLHLWPGLTLDPVDIIHTDGHLSRNAAV